MYILYKLQVYSIVGLPWWLSGKESACQCLPVQKMWVQFLGQEDPLQKEMAAHCCNLAWKIPWTEEPGKVQGMGSQRVGHGLVTKTMKIIQYSYLRFLKIMAHL